MKSTDAEIMVRHIKSRWNRLTHGEQQIVGRVMNEINANNVLIPHALAEEFEAVYRSIQK